MPTARRSAGPATTDASRDTPVRVLKKYPNRRLYDTRTSAYITLADVKQMVLGGEAFEVRDAKSGEDLTRSILLQIILEEESGGVPIFSTQMLAQIIRFYGHSMQGMMGSMLEKNLQAFADIQGQFMSGQAPAMQNFVATYLEQSRALAEQWQRGSSALFPGMPGMPGFGAPKKP
jgi:polyhydroxyalkanoate synthesis repressor PhaR